MTRLGGVVQLQVGSVAEQALGWRSRISTRGRAKVPGLRWSWMADQDTHNPPTKNGFMCFIFSLRCPSAGPVKGACHSSGLCFYIFVQATRHGGF